MTVESLERVGGGGGSSCKRVVGGWGLLVWSSIPNAVCV